MHSSFITPMVNGNSLAGNRYSLFTLFKLPWTLDFARKAVMKKTRIIRNTPAASMSNNTAITFRVVCFVGFCLFAACGAAQTYPNRPIRMIVALGAGGGTDVTGRIVAQKLSEQMGVPVVVENRPGAGTVIGTELVAKSAPDGYTLMTASPEVSINPSLQAKLPYDTLKDLMTLSQLTSGQYFLSTHPSVPVKSVKDLIALAKAKPARVTYGSSGNGSANHLGGVLLQYMTGTTFVHVPYKSAAQSATALMSGETDFMISSTTAAMTPIKSGRLRGIAVTGPKRLSLTPEIPTVSESGVPGYEVTGWYMMLAPAGVPRDIVAKLNSEIIKAVHSASVKDRFAALGTEPVGNSPEACGEFLRAEIAKWTKVVKVAGAKAD
jgi:tripartite-type tricarboxylate transporter receptor subunit TctC